MLCGLADDRNPHLEEIVSNFEMINKRILGVAGRSAGFKWWGAWSPGLVGGPMCGYKMFM